ncbi:MAG: aryl-sulfate sulfotransferase [Myxococcales bacterium]|nr:aryl-sulfate sulfotransferase [Myxococcales bacterium]
MRRWVPAIVIVLGWGSLAHAATAGMAVAEIGLAGEGTGVVGFAQVLLNAAIRASVSPSPGMGPSVVATQSLNLPRNVLSAIVSFRTDRVSIPRVHVRGGGRSWWVPATGYLTGRPGTEHAALIVGMKPETDYTVTVSGIDETNFIEGSREILDVRSGAPPPGFPPIRVPVNKRDKRTPGYVLFDVTRESVPAGTSPSWIVIVDQDGDPVWYYNDLYFFSLPNDVRRISTGNFLMLGYDPYHSTAAAYEINLLGAQVRSWSAFDLGLDSMHHELGELPDGNFVVLSSKLHFYQDYPEELYGYPIGSDHTIVTDAIAVFNPAGEVVYFYDLVDSLDHLRFLQGFEETGFWEFTYGPGVNDWGHGNGVIEDPRDGNWIASLRHQDIVFKMTPEGALVWVLGQHHFTSTADLTWPFLHLEGPGSLPERQHAPELLPNGNLLVYDNASALGSRTSRAVEFAIDEENLTARQVWEWIDPDYTPPLYSIALGDADRISETNVLVDDGAIDRWNPAPVSLVGAWTRIAEVNKVTNEKVFELIVRDDAEEDPESFLSYRAEHLASLYPPIPGAP